MLHAKPGQARFGMRLLLAYYSVACRVKISFFCLFLTKHVINLLILIYLIHWHNHVQNCALHNRIRYWILYTRTGGATKKKLKCFQLLLQQRSQNKNLQRNRSNSWSQQAKKKKLWLTSNIFNNWIAKIYNNSYLKNCFW